MIAVVWWQAILNFLGAILAFFYKLVPNYGVAIILLTLAMRVVLLPLGIKQIRSMQAMQTIQPRVKAIQQKYKGKPDARQKINEETMKLYKEYGVNPLGGCLPMVLQFPVLIALFAVLRVPGGLRHIPVDSRLHHDVVAQHTQFLGANLQCSAQQAGRKVPIKDKSGKTVAVLDCGKGAGVRIPYYVFALAMIGTTYYQQRQMQRASPPGASQQQQTLTKIMPLLFGIWGFIFPAGLVVYWTTTNLVQIGQQHFMLPRAAPEDSAGAGSSDGARKPSRPARGGGRGGADGPRGTQGRGRGAAPPQRGRAGANPPRARPGGQGGSPSTSSESGDQENGASRGGGSGKGGGGGRNAGNRKKRRKR